MWENVFWAFGTFPVDNGFTIAGDSSFRAFSELFSTVPRVPFKLWQKGPGINCYQWGRMFSGLWGHFQLIMASQLWGTAHFWRTERSWDPPSAVRNARGTPPSAVRNARGTPPSANNVNSRGPSWHTSQHFWPSIANQVLSRHVCFGLWPSKRARSAPNMLSMTPTLPLLTKANVTNMCDNWIGKGNNLIIFTMPSRHTFGT